MDQPLVTPSPTIPAPTTHSWLHRPSEQVLLVASLGLAIIVSVIIVCAYWPFISFVLATQGTRFEVVKNGMPTWYEIGWLGTAQAVDGPKGYESAPVTILEAVKYDSPVSDVAVLAKVDGVEGVVLGILHSDNTFSTVLSDGTSKADLAVRPDGLTLFTAIKNGESRIMQVHIAKPETLRDLGFGGVSRLFNDGFFLAISSQGLVRIDPAQEASSSVVLIPNTRARELFGTISPDAKTVLFPNSAGKTTRYTVVTTSPAHVPVLGVQKLLFMGPVSWVGQGYLIEDDATTLRVYAEKNNEERVIGALRIK